MKHSNLEMKEIGILKEIEIEVADFYIHHYPDTVIEYHIHRESHGIEQKSCKRCDFLLPLKIEADKWQRAKVEVEKVLTDTEKEVFSTLFKEGRESYILEHQPLDVWQEDIFERIIRSYKSEMAMNHEFQDADVFVETHIDLFLSYYNGDYEQRIETKENIGGMEFYSAMDLMHDKYYNTLYYAQFEFSGKEPAFAQLHYLAGVPIDEVQYILQYDFLDVSEAKKIIIPIVLQHLIYYK